jgi:DNA-binding protein HU-beta
MNKQELVSEIAEKTGLSKKDAGAAVLALTESITAALKSGDNVTLVGFGTFSVINRKARKGRNPRTGKELIIPSCNALKFTAGKNFKNAVSK